MLKAIFFDAGGVLFLNDNGKSVVNKAIPEFIRANKGRYAFGILSSTDLPLRAILTSYKLASCFEMIQTSSDLGVDKNDPDFLLRATEKLNIKPSEALMIDNDKDFILAAKEAGLLTISYRPTLNLAEAIANAS